LVLTFFSDEKSAFDKMVDDPRKMPSMIQGNGDSSGFQNSGSIVIPHLDDPFSNAVEEYTDDDDPGFDLYEVSERDFPAVSKKLAEKYGFPARAVAIDFTKSRILNLSV